MNLSHFSPQLQATLECLAQSITKKSKPHPSHTSTEMVVHGMYMCTGWGGIEYLHPWLHDVCRKNSADLYRLTDKHWVDKGVETRGSKVLCVNGIFGDSTNILSGTVLAVPKVHPKKQKSKALNTHETCDFASWRLWTVGLQGSVFGIFDWLKKEGNTHSEYEKVHATSSDCSSLGECRNVRRTYTYIYIYMCLCVRMCVYV